MHVFSYIYNDIVYMYISLVTYKYKEMRKIISITHGMWRMKVYIDMITLSIIIVIYNETRQTNRLTRIRSRSAHAFYTLGERHLMA